MWLGGLSRGTVLNGVVVEEPTPMPATSGSLAMGESEIVQFRLEPQLPMAIHAWEQLDLLLGVSSCD